MSYWHIVDAVLGSLMLVRLMVLVLVDRTKGILDKWSFYGFVLLTCYLLHNSSTDIAAMAHSMSICHG